MFSKRTMTPHSAASHIRFCPSAGVGSPQSRPAPLSLALSPYKADHRVSPERLLPANALRGSPAPPAIGRPLGALHPDWSLPASVAGAKADRGDARQPGFGRCPRTAAAGGAWRGRTLSSLTAAVLGGASAGLSRSSPVAAPGSPGLPPSVALDAGLASCVMGLPSGALRLSAAAARAKERRAAEET
ncbi:hypothetical protein R6Z07F_011589 [Ovis aries]